MKNIDETMYMLSEYDELDEIGRCQLLDNLIDIIGDLKDKETIEGWGYTEMVQLVTGESEIPRPFETIRVASALSDEVYDVKVKIITNIVRKKDGDLLISFLGKKSKWITKEECT